MTIFNRHRPIELMKIEEFICLYFLRAINARFNINNICEITLLSVLYETFLFYSRPAEHFDITKMIAFQAYAHSSTHLLSQHYVWGFSPSSCITEHTKKGNRMELIRNRPFSIANTAEYSLTDIRDFSRIKNRAAEKH